jgi:lipopolysaccharide export system protein LptA
LANRLIITLFTAVQAILVFAQAESEPPKTKIEILSADELVYNQQIGRYQICRGNVKFKQGGVLMDCDSARFYDEVNRIEAFGNIYIRQKDTMDLWGDYLEYDGDLRIAKVSQNVRLSDGTMKLKTDQITYDMIDKVGYYTTGGHINNGEDRLYSKRGTYYSRSKDFFFKDSVTLHNKDYVMTSDTLSYNTESKVARFYGPTYIVSEENTIFCNYGWYDTNNEISQFSKGAYIVGKENRLDADSMMYFRNTGFGEGFGNIKLTDTVQNITITGEYGNYNRFDKVTLVTGNPIAIKKMDDDSLYLKADTLVDLKDTSGSRTLTAYRDVKVYKSDLQAVSDSLVYNFTDSTIYLYTEPILWTDSNQITGDTIVVFRGSTGLEKLKAFNNGFVAEKDVNGFFNQISGKTLDAFFSEGKLSRIDVNGNGQSVYYAMEDSATYSGVNDVICGKMSIYIDSLTEVRTITFYNQPKATFYPLEKFPSSKSRLEGLEWRTMHRPKKGDFTK